MFQRTIATLVAAETATLAAHAQAQRSGYCTATTRAQFQACGHETLDDFHIAKAKCINVSIDEEREDCFDAADEELAEANWLCRAQRAQRLEICLELGEAHYDPDFDLADFDSDYRHFTRPTPHFPHHRLPLGLLGELGDQHDHMTRRDQAHPWRDLHRAQRQALRRRSARRRHRRLVWPAQGRDCGLLRRGAQQLRNLPGDNPVRPERVSTHGQWKTGRDGASTGTDILGSARVGDIHRSEFAPGIAEDNVRFLSTRYGFGSDPVLDQHVPRALIDLFCGDRDCLVSRENTGIEPGAFTRKYYARGVEFSLGVDPKTGESVQLVACNFDPRCASLPQP